MDAFELHRELRKVLNQYSDVPFTLLGVYNKKDTVTAFTDDGFLPSVEIKCECGMFGGKINVTYAFTNSRGWKSGYYDVLKERAQDFNETARNAKFEYISNGNIAGSIAGKSFGTEIMGAEIANEILWDLFGRTLTNNIIKHMNALATEE